MIDNISLPQTVAGPSRASQKMQGDSDDYFNLLIIII